LKTSSVCKPKEKKLVICATYNIDHNYNSLTADSHKLQLQTRKTKQKEANSWPKVPSH